MPESGLHGVSVTQTTRKTPEAHQRDIARRIPIVALAGESGAALTPLSPFVILIFSTVMLVILVVGSIALLTTVGETKLPSTLTLAVGPTKRD
jgi:hypothetical protein